MCERVCVNGGECFHFPSSSLLRKTDFYSKRGEGNKKSLLRENINIIIVVFDSFIQYIHSHRSMLRWYNIK